MKIEDSSLMETCGKGPITAGRRSDKRTRAGSILKTWKPPDMRKASLGRYTNKKEGMS